MISSRVLFIAISAVVQCQLHQSAETTISTESQNDFGFPDEFLFGVATAAYQIEGAWNESGRSPSIWDTFTHQHADLISDHSNGDVAADSYHLVDVDLKLLQEVGVQFYRFSISWSRILPNGDTSIINQAGIEYYNSVIDKLLKAGIAPMVTMYHYDLPEVVQNIGGMESIRTSTLFEEYADILFRNFGDRVKYWITFNEPYDYCVPGYGDGSSPPQVKNHGFGEYLCVDTTIKAHALAYRLYRKKYYEQQLGKIGITLSSRFFFSRTDDSQVVDRAMQFMLGWLAHPIYSQTGGYPEVMIEEILRNSIKEGLNSSRLPNMDDDWKNTIKGSADFLGLNYYTSRFVEITDNPDGSNPSIIWDSKLKFSVDPNWKRAKSSWLYSVPDGLRGILKWIKDEYANVDVIITENGWSDDGGLEDDDRIEYIRDHLKAVQNAISQDKCNVRGYAVWSIIDNFEWTKGYTEKFGLYSVNFQSVKKERTRKKSAAYYSGVIKTKKVF